MARLHIEKLLPLLVLSTGLLATHLLQKWYMDAAQQAQQDNFAFQVREITLHIEQRLSIYGQVLRGTEGLFVSSNHVTRNDFRNYVTSLRLPKYYPGMVGIGFAPFVSTQEKNQHIRAMHKEGFPSYRVSPPGERALYTPIVYLEPYSGANLRALGYDMYSEPVRRTAMRQARDSGSPALSGKVTLVQDASMDTRSSFLIYLPVYRNGVPHQTLEERRANILGWAYAPFHTQDLLAGILGEQTDRVGLEIYDGIDILPETRIYFSNAVSTSAPLFSASRRLEIAGHTWTAHFYSLPNYETAIAKEDARIVLVAGILTSILLALLFGQLVSGRIRAQRQVQESRIAATAFEAHESMFITDADCLIVKINHAFTNITGYTVDEVIGQNPRIFKSGMQDTEFYQAMWQRINETGSWEGEIWNRRKDGEIYPEYLTITAVKDRRGFTTNYIATFIDITERKKTEEQLFNSMRVMESKELSKTRFLAAAGHDLRQPVGAANLFIDALKLTSPTPRQSELLAKLDHSMAIFSSLLERLLDISKFDAGLVKPHIVPYNLVNIFNWLEQSFTQPAREKNLRLLLYFPVNKSLLVRIDIGLLQQVLMNLVSNALKFTQRGGILISARLRGDKVLLQVWDTGIGIAEKDLPHIFDEFYQAGNPQRNREAGLGLGLAICKRAMALQEGEVTCRSRLGSGSVFELHLPVNSERRKAERQPAQQLMDKIADKVLFNGKHVVVVEDDSLVATSLVSLLEGLNAHVRCFRNTEEALNDSEITGADFYIVDYSLGGRLNGLQLLETLQQQMPTPLRAVVLTGETSSQFISRTANSPWPVLHKPVSYAKLAASLRS